MAKAEKTPLDRALRLLAMKSRTEVELDRALARGGVEERDRAQAVARLKELGYMDDAAVASARARTLLSGGAAPRLVERKLRAQGVRTQTARAAAEEATDGASERDLVERALERRLRGRPCRDEKEQQKLFRNLVAKGHRPQLVAAALKLRLEGDVELADGSDDEA